ncbi:MAG: MoxR family ATPase [Conexivisphaerales archaeon]
MTINQIISIVEKLYKSGNRQTILLTGSPGIGKSEMVSHLAKNIFGSFAYNEDPSGKGNVVIHLDLTTVEPSDLIGIPSLESDSFVYKPGIYFKYLHDHPGILFLDEFTNINRADILSASLSIIQERRVGLMKLHPDCLIILAGNNAEVSSIANELPTPFMSRVIHFDVDSPRVEEWIRYMDETYKDKWDRRVLTYLLNFKTLLELPKDENGSMSMTTNETYPTPRSWTNLARLNDPELIKMLAPNIIGKKAGSSLQAFLSTEVPTVDTLIKDINIWKTLNLNQKYLLSSMISTSDAETVANILSKLWYIDKEFTTVTYNIMEISKKEKISNILYEKDKKLLAQLSKIQNHIKNV